ncbi:hypothetical protein DPEC_G00219700 [Dallia pectoralis]|uniref:Uncharacterized protein n=1 Tax=Dallia pectoralis TaxID=75939 RepID=A0ACC2G3E1_DALPE|nr:hypothetical protein DPEC_G00219700 [Dallia pectoralis]
MALVPQSAGETQSRLLPLFLGPRNRNVSFVLDTSEAMSSALGSVKRLLIQTLLTKASLRDSLFNIVAFSYKVTRWSERMVPCAPDTVYEALSWIHSLSSSPGRDLLAALSTAFSDPDCHAVHLVTTGVPDHPEELLRVLPTVAGARPVHVFQLSLSEPGSSSSLDAETQDFLQCLTHTTRGSCSVLPTGMDGAIEQVIPLYTAEYQPPVPTSYPVNCSLSTSCAPLQSLLPLSLRCGLGNPFSPISSCMPPERVLSVCSTEFLPGCRVLARRELDGLYQLGTVTQLVQGRRGVYVVEFDRLQSGRLEHGNSSIQNQQQLVCSPDMLNHTQAHGHSLVPGDAALSPWEPYLNRYGPGRVVSGVERRDSLTEEILVPAAESATCLQVMLWDGRLIQVPGDLPVWIPASQHERIIRELQRIPPPPCCRDSLLCAHCNVPAPYLHCTGFPHCPLAGATGRSPYTPLWPLRAPPACVCGQREGRNERAELEKVVDRQLGELKSTKEYEPGASSSSPPSEDEAEAAWGESVGPLASTEPLDKLGPEQGRPAWKYWRRSAVEPKHKQPGGEFKPAKCCSAVVHRSCLPNHNSVFQTLPGYERRLVTIRDVFGLTDSIP